MSGAQQQSRSVASQSPYAQLFRIPGAKAFCISGAVARLPISMMSLGIVLALNHMYDNWTVAGSMSAMYILAVAAVTPFYARLFDRFGQRRVGPVALGVQIVAMLAFALAALARVPIPVLFALAICMGLTQFSFGALVRTRWAYALRGSQHESLLNTAYALEAAIDEIVFIFGPILAAFLATSVHPVSQLFVPTLACGIGGAVFFSLKNTVPPVLEPIDVVAAEIPDAQSNAVTGQPAPALQTAGDHAAPTPSPEDNGFRLRRLHRPYSAKPRNVLTYRGILPLLVVFVVFNMSFTAFDVSMTATMKAAGAERFLGLQLAMFAVGSCIGAVIFGSREMKGSHWRHMVMFLTLLTVGYVVFRMVMGNFLILGVMEILTGLCVSPLFATGNLIVKDIVPARSLTEGLSWVTTAGSVGTSFGSTIAGAVLVLSLGCENLTHDQFLAELGEYDHDRVKFLTCQDVEDEFAAARDILKELAAYAGQFKREPIPVSELVVGMKCGGSDGLSGITANPTIGRFSDMMGQRGGSTVLTEVPEMFGAEGFLMDRCINKEVFVKAEHMINGFKDYFISHNEVVYDNPSPGNKQGGITTLEDKSCGCVQKGGTAPIMDVIGYGDPVVTKGLNMLYGPGNDLVSATAMTAAGAHLILFSTGRGTPFSAPAPTLKISTNTPLAQKKSGWIDFNTGVIADGEKTIDEAAKDLLDLVIRVASGEQTKAEKHGFREISIFKDGVVL